MDTKNQELETLRQVNNGIPFRHESRPPYQAVVYPLEGRKCFLCGKKGHIKKNCRKKSPAPFSRSHVEHPINEEMICHLVINGTSAQALVDSGSQTTIISNRFFKSIQPKPDIETPPFSWVTGVGGNRTEVMGSFQATLEMGEFRTVFPMHILKNTRYDAIVGRDFMDEFVDSISVRQGIMVLVNDGHTPTCAPSNPSKWCAGKLVRGTIIHPGTKRTVSVYPTANILGRTLEIKGSKLNFSQGIRIERGHVNGLAGSMPCTVENRSKKTIRLEADALIARLRVSENIHDEGKPLVPEMNLEGPKWALGGAKRRRRRTKAEPCNIVDFSIETKGRPVKQNYHPTEGTKSKVIIETKERPVKQNYNPVKSRKRPVKSTLKNSLKHMMKVIILLFLRIIQGIGQGREQGVVTLAGGSKKKQNQTLTSDGVSPQHVPTPAFHKLSRYSLIGHSTQCKLKLE